MWGFMIPSCKKNDTLKGLGSPWLHTASQNVQSKFSSCTTKRNAKVQTYQSRNMFFANSSMAFIHKKNHPNRSSSSSSISTSFTGSIGAVATTSICRGRVDFLRSKKQENEIRNDDTVNARKKYEGKSGILLMAEILHHLGDVSQTLEINYQPQLVSRISEPSTVWMWFFLVAFFNEVYNSCKTSWNPWPARKSHQKPVRLCPSQKAHRLSLL